MVAKAHQSTFYQKQRVMKNLQANSQRHRSAAKRNSRKCNMVANKVPMRTLNYEPIDNCVLPTAKIR